MKSFRNLAFSLQVALVICAVALTTTAKAAADAKPSAKPTTGTTSTNSILAEPVIPQSGFEFGGKIVKDPFFPTSTRVVRTAVQTNSLPTFSTSDFKLKGLSGTAENPLALINNRTVAVGEPAEVSTPVGKKKIHCLEIKKFSVVIRVEGQFEPFEIFLPKSDR